MFYVLCFMFYVLFYVTLRYVMLCYVMLCYVMLCYVMLCYVMLCYVMLCYVMLCYVIPMGPTSYMLSVVERRVVMRLINVLSINVRLLKGIAFVASLIFTFQEFLRYFSLPLPCS